MANNSEIKQVTQIIHGGPHMIASTASKSFSATFTVSSAMIPAVKKDLRQATNNNSKDKKQ